MIANEKERSRVEHVNLHANETIRMPREVMQRDTLTEVHRLIIERLPVPISHQPYTTSITQKMTIQRQLKIMFQINPNIRTGSNRPKRIRQFLLMHPDLDIRAMQKLIQSARMVQMQMPNDNLLDIVQLMSGRLNGGAQLMSRLVLHASEDIGDHRAPHRWVILPAPRFPEDQTLVWVVDQNAVHGHFASLVDEGAVLCGLLACVAASDYEPFVAFEPSYFEDVELCAWWTDIGNGVGDGALVELGLDSGHFGVRGSLAGLFSFYLTCMVRGKRNSCMGLKEARMLYAASGIATCIPN